jgi:oxamate amidohydrolase
MCGRCMNCFDQRSMSLNHPCQSPPAWREISPVVHRELKDLPGFSELFLARGLPRAGDTLTNPDLAGLLQHLSDDGLDDFYRGDIGRHLAEQLRELGAPIDGADLAACRARRVRALSITVGNDRVFNLPAPTQGLASLLIIGIYERLRHRARDTSDHVHLLIEATKRAFELRDLHIGDPDTNVINYEELLADASVQGLADRVNMHNASSWVRGGPMADTVWLGALDRDGTLVSYIQSLYWEFGSGVVIPGTGTLWTNRGLCFDPCVGGPNDIGPSRVPRHTLNPAAACFADGRRVVYGAMGGDGQPQTQGAMWWRYVVEERSPPDSISAPRWLLGRTWGDDSINLKMERSLANVIGPALIARGHDLEAVDDLDEMTGQAGMIVRHAQGGAEAATDPRSDGEARTGPIRS